MNSQIPMVQAGLAGLGPFELIVVLLIVLVVFGAGRLPQIGGSMGEAIKNFRKAVKGGKDKEDKN